MQTEAATRESVVAELLSEQSPAPEAVETPQDPPEDAPVEAADDAGEAPPEGEQEIEATPEAESDDGAETPAEVEAEQEPETVIEAPHFWSAEQKARFATLDPETQRYILESDKQAQRTVSQKLEEAAAARKAAEAERQALSGLSERIAEAAEQAETTFVDRWQGMDQAAWLKLSQDDPNKYIQLKAQFDAERDAVQRARAAKDAAEAVERERWRTEQIDRLKTLRPELVDPEKGPENLTALGAYLVKQGVPEQDLPNVGALEMAVAWKAMKFDELQALKPTIKAPPKAALRPGAAPPATPTIERELQQARNRFAQTGSREDAVALMLLEEKAGR